MTEPESKAGQDENYCDLCTDFQLCMLESSVAQAIANGEISDEALARIYFSNPRFKRHCLSFSELQTRYVPDEATQPEQLSSGFYDYFGRPQSDPTGE